MTKDPISGFAVEDSITPSKRRLFVKPSELQQYHVEVYNGKHLLTVITVKAKDEEEASAKARGQFFEDINVKIKRAWN